MNHVINRKDVSIYDDFTCHTCTKFNQFSRKKIINIEVLYVEK